MTAETDPTSIAGKRFTSRPHVQLVVVGAGPAGTAAAIAAAAAGLQVLLVDENPVDAALMGLDVPLFFGGRMDASVQNAGRLTERLLERRPAIAEAFEAGIDVQLGVQVWGAYGNGPTAASYAKPLLGLADGKQSWLQSFDALIVAAGARDLALAFPGWDRPGVMGARAFQALIGDYGGFAGRRAAVLGGGAVAFATAIAARTAGIEVAAVVDVDAEPAAAPELVATAARMGVPFLGGCRVAQTLGRAEVEGVTLASVGAAGATDRAIACDTIVLAVDLAPCIELFDLLGCACAYRPALGGYVPAIDAEMRSSLPHVFGAGDCIGIHDARLADPARAVAEGRRAAASAASFLKGEAASAETLAALPQGRDREGTHQRFLAAHLNRDAGDPTICQCEEVRLSDLIGVRPPRYLRYDDAAIARRNLHGLAVEGPVNQDQIKRLTRAGMGPCQGRRCRDQVQLILAQHGNCTPAEIPMASYRAPLRPLPLALLADRDEAPEIRRHWSAWFGIASQWQPHWLAPVEAPSEGSGALFGSAEK